MLFFETSVKHCKRQKLIIITLDTTSVTPKQKYNMRASIYFRKLLAVLIYDEILITLENMLSKAVVGTAIYLKDGSNLPVSC